MKEALMKHMANEGMTVEQLERFEKLYDKEIGNMANLEVLKQKKQQEETASANKINIGAIAEAASIRK